MNLIKPGQQALCIVESYQLPLGRVSDEARRRWLDSFAGEPDEGTPHKPPRLVTTVAATHAGVLTRNNGFYRPDVMRGALDSFVEPYPKPVLVHHETKSDPLGRVVGARYVDLTGNYVESMRDFRERYGGLNVADAAKARGDFDRVRDQYRWVMKNLAGLPSYRGLGYGELDLGITSRAAAERILDERYLTVSTSFTTTSIRCSICGHDWAPDGPCDHTPGQAYEGVRCSLIPSNMLYDEVSYVNTPADQFVKTLKVLVTNMEDAAGNAPTPETAQVCDVVPILFGVDGASRIYRLDVRDSAGGAPPAQETITVSDKEKPQDPAETVVRDGAEWPAAAAVLLDSGDSYEFHATGEGGKTPHRHRAIVDPKTGNGRTSYVLRHAHEVVNNKIREDGLAMVDEDGKWSRPDDHVHDLGEIVDRLTPEYLDEASAENSIVDAVKKKTCPKCDKPAGQCMCQAKDGGKDKAKDKDKSKGKPWEKDEPGAEKGDEPEGEEKKDPKNEKKKKEKAKGGKDAVEDEGPDGLDFYDAYVVPELEALGMADKALSAEARGKLKSQTFCGPGRSFPVNDCAHYTAAKRLLGRYEGEGDKDKILACIERKGRKLGCSNGKASDSVVDFKVGEETFGLATPDCVGRLARHLGKDGLDDETRTRLVEAGALLGMERSEVEALMTDEALAEKPLEEAIEAHGSDAAEKMTDAAIDDFVARLAVVDEEGRQEMVDKLLAKLAEKDLIPDYDKEFADLAKERDDLQRQIDALLKSNKDMYLGQQQFLAANIVRFGALAKMDEFAGLDEEAAAAKVERLQLRSVQSLSDRLNDIVEAIAAEAAKSGLERREDSVVPGDVAHAAESKPLPAETPAALDYSDFVGVDDATYREFRRLRDYFRQHQGARQG